MWQCNRSRSAHCLEIAFRLPKTVPLFCPYQSNRLCQDTLTARRELRLVPRSVRPRPPPAFAARARRQRWPSVS